MHNRGGSELKGQVFIIIRPTAYGAPRCIPAPRTLWYAFRCACAWQLPCTFPLTGTPPSPPALTHLKVCLQLRMRPAAATHRALPAGGVDGAAHRSS